MSKSTIRHNVKFKKNWGEREKTPKSRQYGSQESQAQQQHGSGESSSPKIEVDETAFPILEQ